MLDKFHRLGYTESYNELQNYEYCFIDSRGNGDARANSTLIGSVDPILEETDDEVGDEFAVDSAIEDQKRILASGSEMPESNQLVSMDTEERDDAVSL